MLITMALHWTVVSDGVLLILVPYFKVRNVICEVIL